MRGISVCLRCSGYRGLLGFLIISLQFDFTWILRLRIRHTSHFYSSLLQAILIYQQTHHSSYLFQQHHYPPIFPQTFQLVYSPIFSESDSISSSVIIFINKITMLSQKRRLTHKLPAHHPKINKYFAENENITSFESFNLDLPFKCRERAKQRTELTEISGNIEGLCSKEFRYTKNHSSLADSKEIQTNLIDNSCSNLFAKFSQLSQSGVVPSPKWTFGGKRHSIHLRQRPRSCSSQLSTTKYQQAQTKKCNMILQLGKESSIDQGRISSSRALIKYSQIQRNASYSRFKVKKEKNCKESYLSATKIVFQIKEKKQKNEKRKSNAKEYSSRNKLSKRLSYLQGQEFQVKGWDYD